MNANELHDRVLQACMRAEMTVENGKEEGTYIVKAWDPLYINTPSGRREAGKVLHKRKKWHVPLSELWGTVKQQELFYLLSKLYEPEESREEIWAACEDDPDAFSLVCAWADDFQAGLLLADRLEEIGRDGAAARVRRVVRLVKGWTC